MVVDRSAVIVYAADEKYALPVAVSGRSVQENVSDISRISWCVLDMGLSDASKDLIVKSWPRVDNVEFLKFDWKLLRGLPSFVEAEGLIFPVQVFGYLLAPQLLRGRHERIICLDADTLVVRDIMPLVDVDLYDQAFGAVRDWLFPEATIQSTSEMYAPEKQLNAGVLVIDSETWCREEVTQRVFEFARMHDDLKLPDQDSLNAVMRRGWEELGGEWNFQVSRTVVREYRGKLPGILHFCGPRKPWVGRSALPHFLRLYRAYARRTAFVDDIPEETDYPQYVEDDASVG